MGELVCNIVQKEGSNENMYWSDLNNIYVAKFSQRIVKNEKFLAPTCWGSKHRVTIL